MSVPAWIEPPAGNAPKRLMRVQVRTDTNRRYEWQERYPNSFAAYDDALQRHPHAARIEVQPVAEVIPLHTPEARHAA